MRYCVEPTEDELIEFRDEPVSNKSIVMLNMLRFRKEADYSGTGMDAAPCSGHKAYDRYSKGVIPLMLEVGGTPLWMGKVRSSFIAPDGESWDQVLLVYYPSRHAFMKMIRTKAYIEVMSHRTAALLDSRLIETQPTRLPKTILRLIGMGLRVKSMLKPRPVDPESIMRNV
ncbi:MAG: hypothetical protein PF482_08780 [Desulfobacteraceae bacterium]|jgi:uncharacterized protein (DUF1330 family)|nr:hypothetical protein [Desulfobacteraceae bacterium]